MNLNKNLHWILYCIFIFSCAKISQPTGGPKDTIPPILISSVPRIEQTEYKGKTIELTFNEIITVNNPKEQLIITPAIGKDFKVEARQTKVLVTLEKPLQDSTTYAFNFRDAIRDVTENNPVRNLRIPFSTGSHIDSMTVEGTVLSMMSQRQLKDVTVAIQPYSDTFSIIRHPATYFTKSDEKGVFKLDNLKPGLYKLYAISDQNRNLIVDSKNEAYAFKRDSILLTEDISNLQLNLINLDIRPLKLTSARPYNTYFNLKTSKNLRTFNIQTEDSVDLYATYGADRSNILIYNSLAGRDSLRIRAILTDSINHQVDTTLYVKFSDKNPTPEKFSTQINATHLLADKGQLKIKLTFTKPIRTINFDSITFAVDSLHSISFNTPDITYTEDTRQMTITKTFDRALYIIPEPAPPSSQPKKDSLTQRNKSDMRANRKQPKLVIKNRLTLGKGAFISIENDSSESILQNITPARTEDLGIISATVKPSKDKVIIQLLNKAKLITNEAIHTTAATFQDLPPDEYVLRLIIDKNGNGRWDPGNYLENEEPEEIHYWKDEKGGREVKLKANFEIGPLLITY